MAEEIKHDWQYKDKWGFTACQRCGIVRDRKGSNADKPCKGKIRISLREDDDNADK